MRDVTPAMSPVLLMILILLMIFPERDAPSQD
jgi:hypothetical protein